MLDIASKVSIYSNFDISYRMFRYIVSKKSIHLIENFDISYRKFRYIVERGVVSVGYIEISDIFELRYIVSIFGIEKIDRSHRKNPYRL